MDTELLRTFSGVARLGSFAAQAREIGVDASAVSRQIAHDHFGVGMVRHEAPNKMIGYGARERVAFGRGALGAQGTVDA